MERTSVRIRSGRARVAAVTGMVVVSMVIAVGIVPSAAVAGTRPRLAVVRGGDDTAVHFTTTVAGEELVDVAASAPGVSWGTQWAESAVVQLLVDGAYATDDVVMASTPLTRSFDLGTLPAGQHVLRFHFDAQASSHAAHVVNIDSTAFHTIGVHDAAYVDLSHSPVLYGRNVQNINPHESGPYQNAITDTPLVAWHEDTPAPTPGHRILEYSIVWSNEDFGTLPPSLMARWGRTTDIEWIYQVEVDAAGNTVPGTAVFQSPDHGTSLFSGTYEGNRPLLQTCTLNNNVCDTVNDPMRFSLSTAESLDETTQAREQVMDANPWTYHVMAEEMRREGKAVVDPRPKQQRNIADPDDYLYLVVRKQTVPQSSSDSWVGLSIGVRLKGDARLYRSDQRLHPDWSLQRDDPAATTVQLPPGTRVSDIAKIEAIRVPVGTDTGATIQVEAINRAFFLNAHDAPEASFVSGATPATLTVASPTAVLYRPAPNG